MVWGQDLWWSKQHHKKEICYLYGEEKKKMGINFELVWCGEPVQQKQTFELIQFSLTCFLTKKKKGLGRDMMNAWTYQAWTVCVYEQMYSYLPWQWKQFSLQFSPMTDWIIWGSCFQCVLQDVLVNSFCIGRNVHSSSISSANHGIANPSGCPEGWFWRSCYGMWHAQTKQVSSLDSC